ncbi:MAG: DUF177 domain-containing protein [Candidatus Poribacteria bacterium]|nr:DUF177 domain-containing protein [Candidatus Poribacteria bacterium]
MASLLEFNVSQLPNYETRSFEFEIAPNEADLTELDDAATLVSPISVIVEATRTDDDVNMTLDVSVEAEYVCGRCVDPISSTLESRFSIFYQPMAERPDYLEDEEEVGLGYYEDAIINIRDDIRRYLLIEIPMWPICREDCAGLCHRCGANLNREACTCESTQQTQRRTRLGDKLDSILGLA